MVTLRSMLVVMIAGLLLLSAAADAGPLDAPAPPSDAASDMITLQELYDYLTTGAAPGAPGAFQEPVAGPTAGTMHTLQEMYAAIKALFDQITVTAANVLSGRKYFSTLPWGIQTGTMPNRGAVTITPGTTAQTILAGYHNGSGTVAGDADLATGNIKSGATIFGVTGTYPLSAVPKTGQITSYATGDDGALQKGVAWPNPRFTDNVNGTVTDNLTGLIWLKNANCTIFYSGDSTGRNNRPWANALTAANSLAHDYCGLSDSSTAGDWRLPNVRELHSLIHFGYSNPALPNTAGTGQWTAEDPFTGVWSSSYWSSTTYAYSTGSAWFVVLHNGYVDDASKTDTSYVWPVRGGE